MNVLHFAKTVLKTPLTFHQEELLERMNDGLIEIHSASKHSQQIKVVKDIIRLYNERCI